MAIKKKVSYQKAALKRTRASALKANAATKKMTRREDAKQDAARKRQGS